MANYVFSTLTTPVSFVQYSKPEKNRFPKVERKVVIKGGANRTLKTLETPRGIPTEVTSDDLVFLMQDAKFQKFHKGGFLTFSSDKNDLDKALKDMAKGDKSQPAVAADFKPGGKHAVGGFLGQGDISIGSPATA